MATLYITEYAETASANYGRQAAAPLAPPVVKQPGIAITGSSTPSAPFARTTHFIEIRTDAECSIDIGSDPVADATKWRIGAGERVFYGVSPGDKLAVIS